MKVTVKLYALLSDYLPAEAVDNRVELDLAEGTTPEDVFATFNLPRHYCSIVLVNGIYVEPSERGAYALQEDDTLAIWPPVAGGWSGSGRRDIALLEAMDEPCPHRRR